MRTQKITTPTKTFRYLWPSLLYSQTNHFKKILGDITRKKLLVNVFLDDVNCREQYYNSILLLIRGNIDLEEYVKFFNQFEIFKDYYDVLGFSEPMHMLVFSLPSDKAYNNFLLSRYSKMYDDKQAEEYFSYYEQITPGSKIKKYYAPYHNIRKTEQRRQQILEEYNLSDDVEIPEYDSKIDIREEIFDISRYIVKEKI